MFGILGTPGYILGEEATTQERLDMVGQNTGNLVFHLAAARLAPTPSRFLSLVPDEVANPFGDEAVIFPAANNLRVGGIGERLMNYLEQAGPTTVVIGLGIQSSLDASPAEVLEDLSRDPTQIRFLKWLKRLETNIGVRGETTSEVLRLAGIGSLVVGCPSLALNRSENLGHEIAASLQRLQYKASSETGGKTPTGRLPFRAAVTAAATWEVYNRADQELLEVERRLFRLALDTDGSYVQQSGGAEIVNMYGGSLFQHPRQQITSVSKILGWDGSVDEFVVRFPDLARVFFDATAWLDYVGQHDFSIGTRVHGNMIGIAAGIPSIFVPHDARTAELIETMKVPRIDVKDLAGDWDVETLFAAVRFDAEAFQASRELLLRNLDACLVSL